MSKAFTQAGELTIRHHSQHEHIITVDVPLANAHAVRFHGIIEEGKATVVTEIVGNAIAQRTAEALQAAGWTVDVRYQLDGIFALSATFVFPVATP